MNQKEKDRAVEIIFYLYFNNLDEELTQNVKFWESIKAICEMKSLNNVLISRAIRILTSAEHCPKDLETYWVLKQMGLSVREINRVSHIYWQKQIALDKEIKDSGMIFIQGHITDPVIKNHMQAFLKIIFQMQSICPNFKKKEFYSIL